ncbi:TfpX/TfpZ family type IV pilin accessory protein [Microbulbifer sp. CnH-101-G]|uniref:TfpX/TfpZ family type IV pilin accessory protein n=1 Tax=Microbulbifer sp. CnH-101-G TaxID=3243393 RepID=UPI00403A3F80
MLERFKAFSLHLLLSSLVALVSLILVFYIWYPGPLSVAMGVTEIFLLMLAVDVVLGPLLTLIVYKAGKKTLKIDLAVIGVLQIAALLYGLNTVAEGRPVWLVFSADRFDAVREMDLDTRYPEKVANEYSHISLWGPRWVAVERPKDQQQLSDITVEAVFSGLDLQHRPYLYQPLNNSSKQIQKKAHSLFELKKFNSAEEVELALKQWPQANAWLPLWANVKPVVVLVHLYDSGEVSVIAVVDLNPWA